ncbi:MAG TPA: thioredoxin domain-containing protein [Ardenticatenaceae bacterium]|nr:thioredoxin domain-containing protein [Ardenticatenaceae bacterium]
MAQRVARRRTEIAEAQPSLLRGPVVLGVVAVAAVLAIALIVFANRPGAAPRAAATYEGLAIEGSVLGSRDAPVTIVGYSDFQCPHCATAAATLLPPLAEQYIASGQVRFEFRPVVYLGQESLLAAEAALCARDQNQFWPSHDKLFASQQGTNRGGFSVANLERFAGEVGLDASRFSACLDGREHQEEVLGLTREAQSRGVEGTPTFFVGDVPLPGAVPFSDMQAAIEERLSQ